MIHELLKSKIAFVGAGRFGKAFLTFLFDDDFSYDRPVVLGVADKNVTAPGYQYAKTLGIFTTNDYTELYDLDGLQIIFELTSDHELGKIIKNEVPSGVRLINHFEARSIWDYIRTAHTKRKAWKELEQKIDDHEAIFDIFERVTNQMATILRQRNRRSYEIEMELLDQERAQSQIIQGSTIPTFVIDKDHRVTHWNKAMEKLSGFSSDEMVGTNRQWMPFYGSGRPTMADVILDQIKEDQIIKYYGTKWRKSALIEGAYEAEGFFPKLGDDGKWCWFTAAPIKAPGGAIIGAIETLWDKTEDKKAEEEKERHTLELSALCSIYSALSAPQNLDERINRTVVEIQHFLSAESICIFVADENGDVHLNYTYGNLKNFNPEDLIRDKDSIILQVIQNNEPAIFENLPDKLDPKIGYMNQEPLKSLAYIPISAKEKKSFGVIRIGCNENWYFSSEERRVLELIGNRIGVAIENARLQDQYMKSEEKYRSLFNNDPNPIFILDKKTYKILDTNQRAEECYGYKQWELLQIKFPDLGDENDEEIERGLKNLSIDQSILFSKKKHFKKGQKPFFVNINVIRAKYIDKDVLIATTTDITEIVEKEIHLIQAGKLATLGLMAAGMAHEINQPLNVIQICADFFLKMIDKGKQIDQDEFKAMAKDIVDNVKRASGVIKHVRDFARQSEVIRNKVNVNDPIKDVFKVLGNQIKVHQIDLDINLDVNLPYIMAEHNRLEQVFINLITNAIDAMDEKCSLPEYKGSTKQLRIESFSCNDKVYVAVSDTGIGMSKETIEKIFEPFFTTKRVGKGTGLGISISYGIVKDYDGTIEIDSEIGKGTTFRLTFPAFQ